MKRFPAYEFPEYVDWKVDKAVQQAYHKQIKNHPILQSLQHEDYLSLYRNLLLTRLHDIQLKRWVKQGVISKAWLGSGEEAVTVGMCGALDRLDVIGPMIRNAGALICRGMPMKLCLEAYLGTTNTLAKGRDLHIGDPKIGVIPPISHVGDIVPVMAGFALSFKLKGEKQVAITWTGDGSTATGIFHEGMRVASSLQVPLISVIQDNQVALGTICQHHHKGSFKAFGDVYGIPALEVDGNNILDCYQAVSTARRLAIEEQTPVLIVAKTFRMGGHATHDEREARRLFSDEVYQYWGQRDPVGCYEAWLMSEQQISFAQLEEIEKECIQYVDQSANEAVIAKTKDAPHPDQLQHGVYAMLD